MTLQRKGIIAAGTLTVDRLKIVDAWPQEEHLANILSTDTNGGGSAHNLAVDIRQLDSSMPVEVIGLLGSDKDGEYLRAKLQRAGINIEQLHSSDLADTAFTDVITDTGSGRRTFFHHRGTNDLLNPAHFSLKQCRGRMLHLGLLGVHRELDNTPCTVAGRDFENGWAAVLYRAQELGIHANLELVSIAPAEIRRIAMPCIEYLDSMIINEFELGALADLPTVDNNGIAQPELCVAAAQSIVDATGLPLLVVHYPQAAIAITSGNTVEHCESFKLEPEQIRGSVGAGDAFAAGVLYGLHQQWALSATLELGHAAAAASLRSVNSVESVESVEQCLSFARGC